jgi:hypothetical protein
MATGALNAQGVWIYGEDDSETTFSALLNKLGTSVSTNMKGRIVQIVSTQYTTETSTTSSSYVDTGLTLSITPTSASSKILVFVTQVAGHGPGDGVYNLRLVRDTTPIGTMMALGLLNEPSNYLRRSHSLNAVVTAGSTSSTTFKTQFARSSGSVSVITQNDAIAASIIAIEVSA